MSDVKKARSSSSASVVEVPPAQPLTAFSMSVATRPADVPPGYLTDVWDSLLRPKLKAVLGGNVNSVNGQRETLYRQVERLVKLRFTNELYESVESELFDFCRVLFEKSDMTVSQTVAEFAQYHRGLTVIAKVFNALDRELMYRSSVRCGDRTSSKLAKDLMTLGFTVWRKFFCNEDNLVASGRDHSIALVDETLAMIKSTRVKARNGGDTESIRERVELLTKMEIFHLKLESKFLVGTKEFYAAQAGGVTTGLLATYLEYVESVLSFEKQFTASIGIPAATWKIVDSEVLRSELVLTRLPALIQRDLVTLVRTADIPRLKSVFDLSNLVNEKIITESVLRFTFGECVGVVARGALTAGPAGVDTVDRIVALRNQLMLIVQSSFGGKPTFISTMKDGIESVLNDPSVQVPSLLAEWVDRHFIALIDAEENATMTDVSTTDSLGWQSDLVGIFKYLNSKDIFEAHYRSFLSKRLVYIAANYSSLSSLINTETAVVGQFKAECGPGFTNKLESMVKDIVSSEEFFQESRKNVVSLDNGVQFKVSVLTTGVWPAAITPWVERVKVPKQIEDLQIEFMRNYNLNFSKKSIKFVYSMTTAVVRHSRRDLVCSAAQAIILTLFNETDSVDVNVVVAETSLSKIEANKAVTALVEGGVLVEDNEIFSPNPRFKSSQPRVVLNQYQFRKSGEGSQVSSEERAQTEFSVVEDRQHQLDAAIVRIMKRVRRCAVAALVGEIGELLKYHFSKSEINRRIDALVDREFLERDQEIGGEGEVRYLA